MLSSEIWQSGVNVCDWCGVCAICHQEAERNVRRLINNGALRSQSLSSSCWPNRYWPISSNKHMKFQKYASGAGRAMKLITCAIWRIMRLIIFNKQMKIIEMAGLSAGEAARGARARGGKRRRLYTGGWKFGNSRNSYEIYLDKQRNVTLKMYG